MAEAGSMEFEIEFAPPKDGDRDVDIGPYCVECREDTTGQEGRTESTRTVFEAGEVDDKGEPVVNTVHLKGWRCEECQPFQSPLIEATFQAILERQVRPDVTKIRKQLRSIGEEKIWELWHESMLDEIEVTLGLGSS